MAIFLMPHYRFFPHVEEDDDDYGDESFVDERRVQAFAMPSLLVIRIGPHRAFLGPDLHLGTRDRQAFTGLGGHLGLAINTAHDHLSIVPEVSLLQVVSGRPREVDEYNQGQSYLTSGDTLVELGLGFSFGAKH